MHLKWGQSHSGAALYMFSSHAISLITFNKKCFHKKSKHSNILLHIQILKNKKEI